MVVQVDKDERGNTHFTPDDTDDCFYIEDSASLLDILDRAVKKWPVISSLDSQDRRSIADIKIEAENINTRYVNSSCRQGYEWEDYTRYLRISLVK